MDNELFGERHEQEENGLFGKRHEAEQLNLLGVVEEFCPKCKSNNIIEISDHYTKCMDCKFEFVG